MIEYPIGTSGQAVVLTDEVVEHFKRHRQIGRRQPEAGGQLFARIDRNRIIVVEATGPRPTDRRGRTSYLPDRAAERAEILERYAGGLHYVGDWHTHPDGAPVPSRQDVESMAECVSKSSHELNGFLLVIVGTGDAPAGLHVSAHGRSGWYILPAS